MREYKGHQMRTTHDMFDAMLRAFDIDSSTLDIQSAGPSKHAVHLNGEKLGVFNYYTGRFVSDNGYKYEWRADTLQRPDGSTCEATFAEAVQAILASK